MSKSTRQAEIDQEQRHLDRVYARLEVVRARAEQTQREAYRLARARTPGSLVERDAMVYHTARRLQAFDTQYEGLVFGRLDLRDGEVRYVGRLGLRDEDHESLVVDWRAPAAAAFYQATPQEPMGVVRRRVIRCRGPRVLDISDDLLDAFADGAGAAQVAVVGDGSLLASLAQARGTRMRDIVATIQREQDEAVRAPAAGVTLIEGGPGTGKTAVALHRAAYLLYHDRSRFEGGGVLLVGPSPVFMSYVERVLPSLGEDTVGLHALGEVVDGYTSDRLDPPSLAHLKGSLRIRRFLRYAVDQGPPDAPAELRVVYAAQLLRVRGAALAGLRAELNARLHLPNAAGAEVRRALVEALWRDRPEGVSWSAHRFAEEVTDRSEFETFARAWWPVLAPHQVLSWLGDVARVRRAGRDWLSASQAEALASSWENVPGDLSVADIALLDELRFLLGSPPRASRRGQRDDVPELSTVTDRYAAAGRPLAQRSFSRPRRPARPDNYDGYAHVLVDEAQDVSPMQWRMLGRRGRQASWTIVADATQSAWSDLDEARRARDEALRGKQVRRFHLGTNYRNSAEIFEFAASVVRRAVPQADLPQAVRSTGVVPQHRVVANPDLSAGVVGAVAELLAGVEGTVGVIAPVARCGQLRELLLGEAGGGRVGDERVSVLDPMRAKGLEYDGVLVVTPDEIVAESARGIRVLYVALTRATHRLITVSLTGAQTDWRLGAVTQLRDPS